MPTTQENNRLDNFDNILNSVARNSKRLKDDMEKAIAAYKRDKDIIIGQLTDSNLDYLHNGTTSPKKGEAQQAIKAIASYGYHTNELTESEAEQMMKDIGIADADANVLPTGQIAPALEPIRV